MTSRRVATTDPLYAALDAEHARRRALREQAGIRERPETPEEKAASAAALRERMSRPLPERSDAEWAALHEEVERSLQEWRVRTKAARRELDVLAARHTRRRRRWLVRDD